MNSRTTHGAGGWGATLVRTLAQALLLASAFLASQAYAQQCAVNTMVLNADMTITGGSCTAARPCTNLATSDSTASPINVSENKAEIISSTSANPITFTFKNAPLSIKTLRVHNAWGVRDTEPYSWFFELYDANNVKLATTPTYTDPNPTGTSSSTTGDTNPPPTVDATLATPVANVKSVRWIITSYYATRIFPERSASTPGGATGDATINYAEVREVEFFGCASDPTIPKVTLAKNSVGATGTFAFTMTNLGNTSDSIATTTVGTPVTSTQTSLVTDKTQPVTLTETAQATYALTGASCQDTNAATTGNPASFGTLAGNVLTIPATNLKPNATVQCTFTNQATRIRYQKVTMPASQNQNFALSAFNGVAAATINASTGATAYAQMTSLAAGAKLTESKVAGWRALNMSCVADTGVNGETAGTVVLSNTTAATAENTDYSSPATTATTFKAGNDYTCTFTNATPPRVRLSKSLPGGRVAAGDQFTLALKNGTTSLSSVTTTGSSTAPTETADHTSSAVATFTLSETAAGTASLANYTSSIACTNATAGSTTGLPSGIGTSFTVTPAGGDDIRCTFTNMLEPTTGPPGGGTGSAICNADPVIAGSDFTNGAWVKTGSWFSTAPGAMTFFSDTGSASLSQSLAGVSPGAKLTFSWYYGNGISVNHTGNPARVGVRYGGIEYWSNTTSPNGSTNSPASTLSGGATCISGCTALAPGTVRQVELRLPTNIPINGTLEFLVSIPAGTAAPADDPIILTPVSVTNTGLCLVKNSIGGTGTFNFATTGVDTTMGGGGISAGITTSAVNTPVYYDASATRTENQPLLIKSPGATANVTITETPAPGFVLSNVSCTGVTPVLDAATNKVTIASVPLDTVGTCTFTNSTSTLNLSKALGGNRIAAADQFTVAVRTGGVSGTVVSSTAASTTTGSGSAVTVGTGTTGDFQATPGQVFTLTEAAASGANLANYTGRLTCTDAAGVMPAASLPTNEAFNPTTGRAVTPLAGANLRCVITNTAGASLSLQKALGGSGRRAASDQFALSATGTGAPAAVNTTGAGTAVTSPTYTFQATPGSAYVLNEAMAAGSASALANYTQSVTCSNAGGPTDVSAKTSLPISITPAVGDVISCVITNTPATPAVTGRVFLDNGIGGGTANDGILNGGEGLLAGVSVRLTNCAATVFSTALTDASGNYSLSVPTGTATGAAMCAEETNPGTRISTGASVGNVALPSGSAVAATGGTYTYTRTGTPDRIAFSWNGTGHANLNFGDVDNSSFAADGAKTGLPGSTVTYAHTFTADTAGQVRFSIASEVATPPLGGWTTKIFADTGCTGSLQPGAAQLFPPSAPATPVVFAGKVCVIVQAFIPANAPQGASNKAKVQADFTYTNAAPSLTGSFTLDDTTTVSNVALELKKEVRNVTQSGSFGINNQAKSGETLEYRITYTNNGDAPIRSMVVNDMTPGYTTFVSATTGTTPASLT
ncbi:MAG: hypothetical protein U1B84_18880, partial [Variovorax sp.]|nr:hypothetical protein [Variovorax sp.]